MSETIEAGRETDARIEREVFRRFVHDFGAGPGADGYGVGSRMLPLPRYSTNRVAALAIVGWLEDEVGLGFEIDCRKGYYVRIEDDGCELADAEADTLALAICRAALSDSVLAYLKSAKTRAPAEP